MYWEIGTVIGTNKGTVKVIGFDGNEALLQVVKDNDGNTVENGEITRFPYTPQKESSTPIRPPRKQYHSADEPSEMDLQIQLAQAKEKLEVARKRRAALTVA